MQLRKMKKLLYLTIVLGLISCTSESNDKDNETKKTIEEVDVVETMTCEKCNFNAIMNASDNCDKLTKEELEQFLCSYDASCDWTFELMETRENQNFGVAWDMLFVHFDKYFDYYIEILEENKSISRDYLIQLFSMPAIYDLPHRQILSKLKEIEKKTEFQTRLENAFEQSVSEGDKLLE